MTHSRTKRFSQIDETRGHLIAAGKELLQAAGGALAFFRDAVENASAGAPRPHLMGFLEKATAVAHELSKSISRVSSAQKMAGRFVSPLVAAIEQEMAAEQRKKKKRPQRRTRGRR